MADADKQVGDLSQAVARYMARAMRDADTSLAGQVDRLAARIAQQIKTINVQTISDEIIAVCNDVTKE